MNSLIVTIIRLIDLLKKQRLITDFIVVEIHLPLAAKDRIYCITHMQMMKAAYLGCWNILELVMCMARSNAGQRKKQNNFHSQQCFDF